ncbi:MAG: acetyl-CoA C-acyltransferase, partial [Cellvibrionaceae bacterium]|nr:acetyl-CoA C-acyltransferase [Cellvibrionaceae bacterium]
PQGIGADLIATIDGYSRSDVDSFAASSHKKAAAAWERGAFDKSIVPVKDANGLTILERDEFIRPETSVETLAALNPSFQTIGDMGFDGVAREKYHDIEQINHVHGPGNSSGIADGAAAILIGNQAMADKYGIKPRAKITATAVVGTDPTIMLTGPGPAAKKALKIAGLEASDLDLVEINEAFASVALRLIKDLELDQSIVNVNGGAIAMGHPLGATGAMILGTLLDELEARDLKRGLACLCVGGGMGIATIIERV